MTVNFVYRPRSGSRVDIENPCGGCFAIKYANGSCHIIGGIELRYETAGHDPAAYWRKEARQAAFDIIEQTGGFVVDECGMIRLIVPSYAAWATNEAMKVIREGSCSKNHPPNGDERNNAALVLGGAAQYKSKFKSSDGFEFGQGRGRLALTVMAVADVPHYTSHRLAGVRGIDKNRVMLVWDFWSQHYDEQKSETVIVPNAWIDFQLRKELGIDKDLSAPGGWRIVQKVAAEATG